MRKLRSSFLLLATLLVLFAGATTSAPKAFANCEELPSPLTTITPNMGGRVYDMRDSNNPQPVAGVQFLYGGFSNQTNGWYTDDPMTSNSSGQFQQVTGGGSPVNNQFCDPQWYGIKWWANPDGYVGWTAKTIGYQILGGADQEFGTNPRPAHAPVVDMGWTYDYGTSANTPFGQTGGYYNQVSGDQGNGADCAHPIYSDNGTGYQGWIDRPDERCNFGLYPYNIRGRVVDQNGNGVDGVPVHATTAADQTTTGGGYFDMPTGLGPSGFYDVWADAPAGYAYARTAGGGWTWNHTLNRDTTSSDTIYQAQQFGSGNDCAGPNPSGTYARCNFVLTTAVAPQVQSIDVFDQTRTNRVANGGMVGSITNNPLDITLHATKGTYTPTELQAFLYSGSSAANDAGISPDPLNAVRLRYASGHYYVYAANTWVNIDGRESIGYPVCSSTSSSSNSTRNCPLDNNSTYLLYTVFPVDVDISSNSPSVHFQIRFNKNFGNKTLHIGGEVFGGQDARGTDLKDFEGSLSH